MAVKQFENYEYDFAKKQKALTQKSLRIASIVAGIIILLFTCWAFVSGFNLFGALTTRINQPVEDPNSVNDAVKEANQAAIDRYSSVKIPYTDPQNRFKIDFSTPYVSDKIVVIINTPQNRSALVEEANKIISEAKQTVQISSVSYVDAY